MELRQFLPAHVVLQSLVIPIWIIISYRFEIIHINNAAGLWDPLRFLNISVRMFLSFAYMADDRVLREMGYFKRYAYASDPRDIDIRWWPIREEAVEALETDEPETNGESEAAPLQSQSAETTQAETRNSELGT